MNEISIKCNLDSPQKSGSNIFISVEDVNNGDLQYKFLIGFEGVWQTLKDFSSDTSVIWTPSNEGKYILMVQAKKNNTGKSFNYVSKIDYVIGESECKFINDICLDKDELYEGEKVNISIKASFSEALFRFWSKEDTNFELLKDYSSETDLSLIAKKPGKHEILIQCKKMDSSKEFDEEYKIEYMVLPLENVEITNFLCISKELVINKDLVFQVEAKHPENRMLLYKFVKISEDGKFQCIQNYSSKKHVSFLESVPGEYKLVCFIKDIYSQKEYDDRALITYNIKPYKDIIIESFTSDISSPQLVASTIQLKSQVSGGKELVYRFIIDGNYGEDSGYIRNSDYVWVPKKGGTYKVCLWVKDVTFKGNYQAKSDFSYVIDDVNIDPVKINDIITEKKDRVLKGDIVFIKTIASGGLELSYRFIVRKDGIEVEKIDYGSCNWVDFTAESCGRFEIELQVKDKYSDREYDSHSMIYIDVYDFVPANIDYILLPLKEQYIVGDSIEIDVITQNTKNVLLRYVLIIEGHKVEETKYIKDKKYILTPKHSGNYVIQIYGKNINSNEEFDCMKEVKVIILDAMPVRNIKISCDKTDVKVNEAVIFTCSSEGGREVLYEFYLMEKDDWILVQEYSRKNYYSFIPFSGGVYNLLALTKSTSKKCAYEDYSIFSFDVNCESSL